MGRRREPGVECRVLEAEGRAERVRQFRGHLQHVLRVLGDRRLQRWLARRPLIRPTQSVVRRPRVGCCQLAFCCDLDLLSEIGLGVGLGLGLGLGLEQVEIAAEGEVDLLSEVGPACRVLDAAGHVASEGRAAAVVYRVLLLRALSKEAAGLGLDVLYERCRYAMPQLEESVVVARLSKLPSKAGGIGTPHRNVEVGKPHGPSSCTRRAAHEGTDERCACSSERLANLLQEVKSGIRAFPGQRRP